MSIRLIVGLGNPGPEYEQTRHNAGFWLVDTLAANAGVRLSRETRYQALAAKTVIDGAEVWLLEPQTYMNRSGQSVGMLARFYKIVADEILVVHDELDLPPGAAKIKKGGSSGGHNGLKDITAALGTQDYWRLRLGIGHPRALGLPQPVVDYVLHRPRREEQLLIDEAISQEPGSHCALVPRPLRGGDDAIAYQQISRRGAVCPPCAAFRAGRTRRAAAPSCPQHRRRPIRFIAPDPRVAFACARCL